MHADDDHVVICKGSFYVCNYGSLEARHRFDDGAVDSPRAYRVQVLRTAGASKTLIISLVMSTPGGGKSKFKMLFALRAG